MKELLKQADEYLNGGYAPRDKGTQLIKALADELRGKEKDNKELKALAIMACSWWVETEKVRWKLIDQKDLKKQKDMLIMEWPMVQGTSNQIKLKRVSEIPCNYKDASEAIKKLLPQPPKEAK